MGRDQHRVANQRDHQRIANRFDIGALLQKPGLLVERAWILVKTLAGLHAQFAAVDHGLQ